MAVPTRRDNRTARQFPAVIETDDLEKM
jgi:hypothetical protein